AGPLRRLDTHEGSRMRGWDRHPAASRRTHYPRPPCAPPPPPPGPHSTPAPTRTPGPPTRAPPTPAAPPDSAPARPPPPRPPRARPHRAGARPRGGVWLAGGCAPGGSGRPAPGRAGGPASALGHALAVRAVHGSKTGCDRHDAEAIARLLKGGNFPPAYAYPR